MTRPFWSIVALFGITACSPAVTTTTTVPAPAARTLPNDVRWFRVSAEYRALAYQAYNLAQERLPELSRGLASQSWAVILDADETVLDNSEYQRRRALIDSGYTSASWAVWVNERKATPIPGAVEFIRRVRALGGRVAIVTNRTEAQCDATRENLRAVGVEADAVLCQRPNESDKNPRFRRVESGEPFGGGPLKIVAWVGDNILDFPGMTQAVRAAPNVLAEFGRRYFILPNPMYGSWQSLPEP
jgi:acid phosphatase